MSEHFDPYYKWLGIRPQDQPPSHYRLLGVSEFEDDRDVIENAADRQMAHLRSFAAGKHAEVSQKLLNEIAAAKVCLLNPARKAEYDAHLRSQQAQAEQPEPSARQVRAPLRRAQPERQAAQFVSRPEPQPGEFVPQPLGAAAATGSRVVPRRRQPKWLVPALVGGGGMLVVAVLVLAFAAGRSQPVAENAPAAPPPPPDPRSPTPAPVEPPGATPASAGTPGAIPAGAIPADAIPAGDAPQGTVPGAAGGDAVAPPEQPQPVAAEWPKYALRFAAGRHVELQDSATLIAPGGDFTIEAWVRPGEIRSSQNVVGDFALGGTHAELPPGTSGGWALTTTAVPGGSAYGLTTDAEIKGCQFARPPAGRWVHLAATYSRGTLRLFENGRYGSGHEGVQLRSSPFNIFLGNSGVAGMQSHFSGDICGLRISRAVRYQPPVFEPPRRFAADADALVVLDFDHRGDTIRDLSGHGHHGTITGATWIDRSAPPGEPATVAQLPPYALRLTSADRVELKDTKTLELPLTIEVWARPDPSEEVQMIVGNLALPATPPQPGGEQATGWALCDMAFGGGKRGLAILQFVEDGKAGGHGRSLSTPLAGRWSHIAACLERGDWALFLNGELMSHTADQPLAASRIDLTLGRAPSAGDRIGFEGCIAGLRISRGRRYRAAFEPQGVLERDEDTLVLLDFSAPHQTLIPDRSGNGHEGVIFGAEWVRSADTTTSGGNAADATPPPQPAGGADRQVAEWARGLQAAFGLIRPGETHGEFIRMTDPLPDYAFYITQLNLQAKPLTDDDLERLTPLQKLSYLNLDDTPVTDAGMRHLAGLPQLRSLSLRRTPVGREGLKNLGEITGLTMLDLQGARVDDAGLAQLAKLERLNMLQLGDTAISDAGLAHLARMQRMRVLYLDGSAVTGAGLAEVAKLPGVQILTIGPGQCSDAGLAHLAAAANLHQLTVQGAAVAPNLVVRLCAARQLRMLYLRDCRLTTEAVQAMAGLKQLKSIMLLHCGVSAEDSGKLQAALPDCRVEHIEDRRIR